MNVKTCTARWSKVQSLDRNIKGWKQFIGPIAMEVQMRLRSVGDYFRQRTFKRRDEELRMFEPRYAWCQNSRAI